MKLFQNIGKAVTGAASYLTEKNRRAARLNRVRTVIKCQEKAAEKEYLALGRYYYHNLRDKDNTVTEGHCAALDQIEEALDAALDQLEKFYGEKEAAAEEITLEDVQVYDEEPVLEDEALPAGEEEAAPAAQAGEEEDDLPFEG